MWRLATSTEYLLFLASHSPPPYAENKFNVCLHSSLAELFNVLGELKLVCGAFQVCRISSQSQSTKHSLLKNWNFRICQPSNLKVHLFFTNRSKSNKLLNGENYGVLVSRYVFWLIFKAQAPKKSHFHFFQDSNLNGSWTSKFEHCLRSPIPDGFRPRFL